MILTKEEFDKKYGGETVLSPEQFKAQYPPAQPTKKKGLLEKTRDSLLPGVTRISQTIGDALAVKSKDFKKAQESQAGLDALNIKVAQKIAEQKKAGEDTEKLEGVLASNKKDGFKAEDVAPSINKSTKQIIGEGVMLVTEALGFGALGTNVGKQVLTKQTIGQTMKQGAKIGATWGAVGSGAMAMADGKDTRGILSSVGVGAVAGAVLSGIALPAVGGVLSKAKNALTPGVDYLRGKAELSYKKGVKPLLGRMQTASKQGQYVDSAIKASSFISSNKDKLKFVDIDTGEIIKGRNPKNLSEFAQAVEQMKTQVYKGYDSLARSSDLVIDSKSKGGGFTNIKPVVDSLELLQNDLKFSPQIRNYAKSLTDEISELDGQPATVIQERIKELNSSLGAFYDGRVSKAKAQVDASVANLLRENLDDFITSKTGDTKYLGLRKMYGHLKTIEKDVNRRALAVARKNEKGLAEGLTDVFSGGDLLMGLVTANPGQITRALTIKGMGSWIKNLNNPDKQIETFFNLLDKLQSKTGKTSVLDNILREAVKERDDIDKAVISGVKNLKDAQPGLSIEDITKKPGFTSAGDDLISAIKKAKAEKMSFEEFVENYSERVGYGMQHRPAFEGMPPAHNLLEGGTLPRDVYEKPDWSIASGRIRNGDKAANESWNALQRIRNKPNAEITIYRASPKKELNNGDWVTLSKEYAKQEALSENVPVNSFKVKASDVIFAGDDINEFGYWKKSQLQQLWDKN